MALVWELIALPRAFAESPKQGELSSKYHDGSADEGWL